jgi:hypothetical protein
MKPLAQITILSIIAAMSTGCSSNLKLNSHWRQQEITVDGESKDWQDGMTFVEKKNVSLGVANDEDYLYICLVATDRELLRQIIVRGLTLWFDPEGGKEKTFGIRFPLGLIESGLMRMPGRGRGGNQETVPETMRENFEQSLTKIEVIWPEKKERLRFDNVSALPGIAVKVKLSDAADTLIYEIKVPLLQTEQHRFAIGTEAGERLGVGFETTQFDREKLRERMRKGGFGGGRGGGRGGFGGRGNRGRPQMPKPFELWVSVRLGSEGASLSPQPIPDEEVVSTEKINHPKTNQIISRFAP